MNSLMSPLKLWLNRRGSLATESCSSSAGTSAAGNDEQELEENFTVDACPQILDFGEGSSQNHHQLTMLNTTMGGGIRQGVKSGNVALNGQQQNENLLHLLLSIHTILM